MVHGISGNNGDAFRYLNALTNAKQTEKTTSSEAVDAKTPIDITGKNTVGRSELDNVNPYAAMGVNISKPTPGTTAAYAQAAPEFGSWQGNYTITNTKEANYDLADYRAKLNPAKFAAQYVNPEEVAEHMQTSDSPYAELFA